MAKVYQADPLACRKCGAKLKVSAYITDASLIRRILDHLGLRSPPQDKRPPAAREVHRVPVDEEGESGRESSRSGPMPPAGRRHRPAAKASS